MKYLPLSRGHLPWVDGRPVHIPGYIQVYQDTEKWDVIFPSITEVEGKSD